MQFNLLKQQISDFKPLCEQEERDRILMLKALSSCPDILTRENETAHFTASAWVRNKDRDKVLMLYHNIYHSWSWAGGHADGEEDLFQTACREVREETGIQAIKPAFPGIFSLEILTVDGHEKRGRYVSSHLHYNVTYLFEADEKEELSVKPDENSSVKWIAAKDLEKEVAEEWMMQRIYKKLLARM